MSGSGGGVNGGTAVAVVGVAVVSVGGDGVNCVVAVVAAVVADGTAAFVAASIAGRSLGDELADELDSDVERGVVRLVSVRLFWVALMGTGESCVLLSMAIGSDESAGCGNGAGKLSEIGAGHSVVVVAVGCRCVGWVPDFGWSALLRFVEDDDDDDDDDRCVL